MRHIFSRFIPFAAVFLVIQTLVRLTLAVRVWEDLDQSLLSFLKLILVGAWFDLAVLAFILIPLSVYWLALPKQWHGGRVDTWLTRMCFCVFLFVILFTGVSEHFFWNEFGARFNFIAVDYLVYTQEVIGNIYESYPVIPILAGLAVLCILFTWGSRRFLVPKLCYVNWGGRLRSFAMVMALPVAMYNLTAMSLSHVGDNVYSNEVASNGIYNLFWAYSHNEIDYKQFYLTRDDEAVKDHMRTLLTEEHMTFESPDGMARVVRSPAPELHKNVIIVVMESMSAAYMEHFGSDRHLTPNLDAFADQGLFFTKFYATGTRTVRGLEAVVLSVPPTPGQSIIRRPSNENLYSLGFVFKDRGYDTKFIYGGYGYFDNMNYFFANNGFDVVDRSSMSNEEIHFANVWGVADEDLFMKVMREADQSFARHKPFMHVIMTTSNHRPYTYPEGKIDIPPQHGREGGVKYADYAVGRFIEEAKKKPWFKDTVFVFVADHTAGASGKVELATIKYHIPLIVYAPGFIQQRTYDKVASQIDIAPIILGQLQFSYRSRFLGEDILHDEDEIPHAFISNYQKVALIKEDQTIILEPKQQVEGIVNDQMISEEQLDPERITDAVTYYQYASSWKEHSKRIDTRLQ